MKLFEDYLGDGIVYKSTSDIERAKSLILYLANDIFDIFCIVRLYILSVFYIPLFSTLRIQAQRKMRSLLENLSKVGITQDNTNDSVESCYDILLFLVRAAMYTEGYVARGQGAHEAEVVFTRRLEVTEADVIFLDRMRYFRNGMLYYGTMIDREYTEKVIIFTKRMYERLKVVKGL